MSPSRQFGHGSFLYRLKWGDCWTKVKWAMSRWWGLILGPHSPMSIAWLRKSWEEGHCWTWASTVCSLSSWFLMARGPSPSKPQGIASTQVTVSRKSICQANILVVRMFDVCCYLKTLIPLHKIQIYKKKSVFLGLKMAQQVIQFQILLNLWDLRNLYIIKECERPLIQDGWATSPWLCSWVRIFMLSSFVQVLMEQQSWSSNSQETDWPFALVRSPWCWPVMQLSLGPKAPLR